MEAISFLSGWITWLLIIIPVAAGCVVTYFSLRKALSNDEGMISECNKNIMTTIKGAIICETISGLITIIKAFYI